MFKGVYFRNEDFFYFNLKSFCFIQLLVFQDNFIGSMLKLFVYFLVIYWVGVVDQEYGGSLF